MNNQLHGTSYFCGSLEQESLYVRTFIAEPTSAIQWIPCWARRINSTLSLTTSSKLFLMRHVNPLPNNSCVNRHLYNSCGYVTTLWTRSFPGNKESRSPSRSSVTRTSIWTTNSQEHFKVSNLCHTATKVAAYRSQNRFTQWYNCQKFRHVWAKCKQTPRYLWCQM
jgi:hypothetical protein